MSSNLSLNNHGTLRPSSSPKGEKEITESEEKVCESFIWLPYAMVVSSGLLVNLLAFLFSTGVVIGEGASCCFHDGNDFFRSRLEAATSPLRNDVVTLIISSTDLGILSYRCLINSRSSNHTLAFPVTLPSFVRMLFCYDIFQKQTPFLLSENSGLHRKQAWPSLAGFAPFLAYSARRIFKLEEHDIHYRPRTLVKGQILADFIMKRPEDDPSDTPMEDEEELPDEKEVLTVVEEEEERTWINPIQEYLTKEILPEEKRKARIIRRKAGVMRHTRRSKIRGGESSKVRNLILIASPWPFYKWEIDIAGPFPEGPGKVKFLIVAIDYFTKWIEAKLVTAITRAKIKKFYGTEAVILVEIGMPTLRIAEVDMMKNDEALEINLDLLEERREHAAIQEAKSKAKMEK
nr:gypsy retrotransposon integrase-like protein 1 [Tanacetum cinerariifolium]